MTGYHTYKACVDACLHCAAVCSHCASSCLQEQDVKMMARCIQLDMECSALCYAAAQLMSIGSSKAQQICRICSQMCGHCAAECSKHQNDHCQECAAVCKNCAQECKSYAA